MYERTTVGFVQVRLEVVAIGSFAYPSFGSGERNIAEHLFLLFIFIKKPGSGYGRTEFFYDEFMLHRLEKDFHIFLNSYITIVLI